MKNITLFKIILLLIKRLFRFSYLYLGIGHIYHMIRNPTEVEYTGRKPSSFVFWLIAAYVGLFGIAYQRYENRISRLISIYDSYLELMGEPMGVGILQDFIDLQNYQIPIEPNIWLPHTTLLSFSKTTDHEYINRQVGRLVANNLSNRQDSIILHLKNLQIEDSNIRAQYPVTFQNSSLHNLRLLLNGKEGIGWLKYKDNYFKEVSIESDDPNLRLVFLNSQMDHLFCDEPKLLDFKSSILGNSDINAIDKISGTNSIFIGVDFSSQNVQFKDASNIFIYCTFSDYPPGVVYKSKVQEDSVNTINEKLTLFKLIKDKIDSNSYGILPKENSLDLIKKSMETYKKGI